MIRTQIQLTEKQYKMLKEISANNNTSIAEVVRECIAYYSASKCMISNEEKYSKAINSIGKFKSGEKDISIKHDKYLAEDFKK
ncbi:MAG: CopG family transcriptional regulator [Actinobacteria bacterium]|jgi:predicted DNA-binding protein|nr:CopG family transcriptional regulator [Actinomycetota bacterium]